MINVEQERYCPRLSNWLATWGPGELRPEHYCHECGSAVVYNGSPREGPVRLVCLECLHALTSGERPEERDVR